MLRGAAIRPPSACGHLEGEVESGQRALPRFLDRFRDGLLYGPLPVGPGRLAQRESVPFTRERS